MSGQKAEISLTGKCASHSNILDTDSESCLPSPTQKVFLVFGVLLKLLKPQKQEILAGRKHH